MLQNAKRGLDLCLVKGEKRRDVPIKVLISQKLISLTFISGKLIGKLIVRNHIERYNAITKYA